LNNKDNTESEKLTFQEKLFFPEIAKGMAATLKEIFRPKFTRQYPEERWEPTSSYRGRPVLVSENGKERCVACGLCSRVCPALAIYIEANEINDLKERAPKVFEIDMLRCIYCGLCEEACPEEAIVMSKDYELIFQDPKDAIMNKECLLTDISILKDRLGFLKDEY
jgi:NADH-quinone oxidoreductase subunit I